MLAESVSRRLVVFMRREMDISAFMKLVSDLLTSEQVGVGDHGNTRNPQSEHHLRGLP